jgi:hypothetical protein
VKTLILGLFSLLVVSVFTPSHSFRVQSRNDEESIKSAYRGYVQAWKTKDLAVLKDVISPDYMAVNVEGTLSSREIELATAKNDNEWTAMTVDEIYTRVWQDSAIASGLSPPREKRLTEKPLTPESAF